MRIGSLAIVVTVVGASISAPAAPVATPSSTRLNVPSALRNDALASAVRGDPAARQLLSLSLPRRYGGGGFVLAPTRTAGGNLATESGAIPFAVADADGDGRKDLYLLEYRTTYDANWNAVDLFRRVVVRRGRDGNPIWATAVMQPTGNLFVLAADMNGDGRPDVVTFDSGWRGLDSRKQFEQISFDQITTVLDASSGALMWTRSDPGSITKIGTPVIPGFATVATASGLVSQVVVVPGDAEAGARVMAGYLSYTRAFAHDYAPGLTPPHGVKIDESRCDSNATLFDGATGTVVHSIESGTRDSCGIFVPVADQTGDGIRDMVLATQNEMELRGLDGTSVYWHRPVSLDDDYLLFFEAPVKDASTDDVVVVGINLYIFASGNDIVFVDTDDHVAAFAGSDGTTLSDLRTDGLNANYFAFAGATEDRGGLDFYEFTSTPDHPFVVKALSGAGGSELWSRSWGDAAHGAGLVGGSDLDGNGSIDLIVSVDSESGQGPIDAEAWSGSGGGTIWRLQGITSDQLPESIAGGDLADGRDVNGDGRDDLATWTTNHTEATFLDGTSLSTFWSVHLVQQPRAQRFLRAVYDLRGSGNGQALVEVDTFADGNSSQSLELYDAGGLLWSVMIDDV